jgi:hypothetical protein
MPEGLKHQDDIAYITRRAQMPEGLKHQDGIAYIARRAQTSGWYCIYSPKGLNCNSPGHRPGVRIRKKMQPEGLQ